MLETKRFQRTVENFACAHCGHMVNGDGFTNHCPQCLWSLHCDHMPGDRAESCRGLMEPQKIIYNTSKKTITHRCTSCGTTKNNKISDSDNFNSLLELAGHKR